MTSASAQIIIGNIVHCKNKHEVQVLENGYIIVVRSKILAIGLEPTLKNAKTKLLLNNDTPTKYLRKSQILIPGLVDTHLHAPQYPNCGLGYGKPLLEWLNVHTYPLEKRYSDLDFSRKVFKAVVKKTLAFGTTTACYFGTLFNESTNILVDAVIEQGQRALVGKVNMTTAAPEDYVELPEKTIANTLEFIKYVQSKKSDLVKAIITPRFALSLELDTMTELSQIAKCNNLHIQTHISENVEEVEQAQTMYGMEYAFIYDKANLLTQKTILAHAIYLSEEEMKLIARRGTSVAHCPDSNISLRSGVCNVRQLWDFGVSVGLGTDVSGGTNVSLLRTMKMCLDSSIHISFHLKDYVPLNFEEVFYLGTLGGSQALSLSDVIGNFEINKDFDALIVDMDIQDGEDYLLELTPKEILQKFIYNGDDRNIINVFVAGKLVK